MLAGQCFASNTAAGKTESDLEEAMRVQHAADMYQGYKLLVVRSLKSHM